MTVISEPSALVGYSGFVGSTLLRQTQFSSLYRSTNIDDIVGQEFSTLVCAAAPAQKWLANRDPQKDQATVAALIERLRRVKVKKFILISTVDVFREPCDVDESSRVEEGSLHPYGLNRRRLEQFVSKSFPSALIVRLPGLVGPGLRKNIVYDFKHNNNVDAVDSRAVFQFYPMANLWADIQRAAAANLQLVHFNAEPVRVSEVAESGFGMRFTQTHDRPVARYDVWTQNAETLGGTGRYMVDKAASLRAIRDYAQSEVSA